LLTTAEPLEQQYQLIKIDVMGAIKENANNVARIAKTGITITN